MTTKNRIVKIECTLNSDNHWRIDVTKEFEPKYGGGTQTFTEAAPSMHRALDVARKMVTMSPGQRTDAELVSSDPEQDHPWRG